jgi:hypothetical protein
MNGQFVTSLRAVAASVAAGVVRGAGRLELETVALTSMNELKRPDVIGGKIRTVTNAQHGGILQFTVEQAHDTGFGFPDRARLWLRRETPSPVCAGGAAKASRSC